MKSISFRAFVLLLMLALMAKCASRQEGTVENVKTPDQPNVLFILADDLGYSDLACMGSSYYETPNLDRLAAMGARFTNGYANCRVCSPSRASLLTGQIPARHGITDWIGARTGENWRTHKRHNKLLPAEYVRTLPAANKTMPEAFREAGYKTFFAGKWHLGSEGSWPEDHGFEINVGGFESGGPRGGYYAPFKNPKLREGQNGENLTLRLARETADFISAYQDSSFFAYLSFYAVHGPVQSTRAKWDKYRRKALEAGVADEGFTMERVLPYRLAQDYPVYAGLVEQMDDAVGIVLDSLEANGLLSSTIIVFTSDNGGVVSGDGYSTNLLPLRGGKGYQWEGGIKVPLLLYAPGYTEPGSQPTSLVTGVDLYPTLLELAGLRLQPEEHRDGISLIPALSGDTLPERDLVWHYPHYGNQGGEPSSILRRGDWKLIHYYEDGRDELYQLSTDAGEQQDLSTKYPMRAKEMRTRLLSFLDAQNAKYPLEDPTYDPQARTTVLESYRGSLKERLERTRAAQYDENWSPNADWWGSLETDD
ncbi:sulfatase [Lewinella sp. 4G2]|uniref:sulfatase n=1 Tax=Lewinella sp. 4G2 TaxID=1803372 RepID=UPI0007B48DDB|nr:sulfatase [Lewinella sp. 4G2]OAV45287.1 sulfatase [Lewinella sp. 4G2]